MKKLNLLFGEKKINLPSNKINNYTEEKKFEYNLNKINLELCGNISLSEILEYLNVIIDKTPIDIFDSISIKYFNKLTEIYKEIMNHLKNSNNHTKDNKIYLCNLEQLIKSFTIFFRNFHDYFQNYNEKHKNLIKLIPNTLKIFFKLFEEVFLESNFYVNLYPFKTLDVFNNFALCSSCLINYFPTMMRGYESRLEAFIRIVTKILVNISNDPKIIKTICMLFAMLIRISNDYSTKLSNCIKKIDDGIIYLLKLFEPKTLKGSKNTKNLTINESQPINFIINLSEIELKSLNLMQIKYFISFIFDLKITILKTFPESVELEFNTDSLVKQLKDNIEGFYLISKKSDEFIVDGYSFDDYAIFRSFIVIENLRFFVFILDNYSEFLYNYIPIFKTIIDFILNNFEDLFSIYFEVYLSTLKFLNKVVKNMDCKILTTTQEILFKTCIGNFPEIYILFLEKNDKTVVKVDQNYFKLSKIKSTTNKNSMSLIQLAKLENLNEKFEGLSNSDIERILILYLKSKI